MSEPEGLVQYLAPLLTSLGLLLPAAAGALWAHVTRPRFTAVGMRHRTAHGQSYRFIINYLDDAQLDERVQVRVRLRRGSAFVAVPKLLVGPPPDPSPTKTAENEWTIAVDRAYPRSAWVLVCKTDGAEDNVEVGIPDKLAFVGARSVLDGGRLGRDPAVQSRWAWLGGVLMMASLLYAIAADAPGLRELNPLHQIPIVNGFLRDAEEQLSWYWELVPVVLGVLAIYAMHYVCMRWERVPLAQGYLDDGKDEEGGDV